MKRQLVARVERTNTRGDRVQGRSRQLAPRGSHVLGLQRTVGNQAVQRLIRSPFIQAKLQISTPGDRFEQEADRVADTVMRMSSSQESVATSISQPQISRIQRTCAACEKEAGVVQRACKSCHGGPLEENEPLQREAEDEDSDEMLIRFAPIAAMVRCTADDAPCPTSTIAMTAAMPMMMPRQVSSDRPTLRLRLRTEVRMVFLSNRTKTVSWGRCRLL